MFLQLNHQRLDVYAVSISLVQECYKLTQRFPADERFALCSQIRRAAVSVHLNIAEGCSRKSEAERKRFFEIARGSLIEIDAALDVAESLHYCQKAGLEELGTCLSAALAFFPNCLPEVVILSRDQRSATWMNDHAGQPLPFTIDD